MFFLVLLASHLVQSDVYLGGGTKGSNNRLDERGRDRANGNRMFDSQNNNRGGYNVGHVTYYTGESIPITWTNQHGSGQYQLDGAELLLQYTCDALMRDGTTTNRIPDDPTDCQDYNCDTDVEYGRHESFASYQYCKATSRNMGLFTANQNMRNRNSAKYTRQDNQGTRYGYECPEERDYYPYWRGSVWRDLAIYTNTPQRCSAYQRESQNVASRWECRYSARYWDTVLMGYVSSSSGELPLSQVDCENDENGWFVDAASNATLYKYEWTEVASFGVEAPACTQSLTTRVNHHGLTGGRSYWTHNWKIPSSILEMPGHDRCCVVRLRYNITTADYAAWDSDEGVGAGVDWRHNANVSSPNPDDDPAWIRTWEQFGLTYEDVSYSFTAGDADDEEQKWSRGYVFRNDPEVDPFGYAPMGGSGADDEKSRILLELAINTDQFGRTFQDRTHCFSVKDRAEAGISGTARQKDITLVTVSGKRGNIVQVYPATEYFFMPEPAFVYEDSYVHFCWTGSNRNPNNNDGQGLQGSDRSNVCPLTQPQWDKQAGGELGSYGDVDGALSQRASGAVGDLGNSYPDWIGVPEYGMPVYYNYAPKRDLPRKSASAEASQSAGEWWAANRDSVPYNDPYNAFWFGERGAGSQMAGFDVGVLGALCTQRITDSLFGGQFGLFDYGNMEELDDTGTTFCIEPVRVQSTGIWHYLSTRNNNFSNRSQKGSLIVSNAYTMVVSATASGFSAAAIEGQAKVVILPDFVQDGDSLDFTVTTWLNRGETSTIVQLSGNDGASFSADSLTEDAWIELWIPYTSKSLSKPKAWFKADADDEEWSAHSDASIAFEADTHYAVVQVQQGGYYTVSNEPDILAYIACILGVALFGTAFFFVVRRNCIRKKETA